MEEVIKLFKQIQSTSSLNQKTKIIKENENNVLFKKCLKFLLDSNVVTGISEKKIHKKIELSSELTICQVGFNSTFEYVMKYLQNNNTGRDEDIYMV